MGNAVENIRKEKNYKVDVTVTRHSYCSRDYVVKAHSEEEAMEMAEGWIYNMEDLPDHHFEEDGSGDQYYPSCSGEMREDERHYPDDTLMKDEHGNTINQEAYDEIQAEKVRVLNAPKPYPFSITIDIIDGKTNRHIPERHRNRIKEMVHWSKFNDPFGPFVRNEKGARPLCNKSYSLGSMSQKNHQLVIEAVLYSTYGLEESKELCKHLADAIKNCIVLSSGIWKSAYGLKASHEHVVNDDQEAI